MRTARVPVYHQLFSLSCSFWSVRLEFPSVRQKFSAALLLLFHDRWLGNLPQGQFSSSTLCFMPLSAALTSAIIEIVNSSTHLLQKKTEPNNLS